MEWSVVGPTLVAVFAHPDDESFLCGGALARHTALGWRVLLVCATRGEAGEISDPALATPETLPTVREAELRTATRVLGIEHTILLDYQDGTLWDAPFLEGVERVGAILDEARPRLVLTFG